MYPPTFILSYHFSFLFVHFIYLIFSFFLLRPHSEQTKAYLELRIHGLRILKYLCKDHKNCLRIGEAKGLLSILIFFIEIRNEKAFEVSSSSRKDPDQDRDFFSYRLKKYKKSLQVIGLLAATTNTSGGILRSRIAAVVSGLKNLRDMIHYGKSQPELQRLSVEILFHLAIDSDVRETIGATGGIIRNLYDLFASFDAVAASGRTSSNLGTISKDSNVTKEREVRQLASQIAGNTLSRIVLQNEKNCLKLVHIESESPEQFLKCKIEFLKKPLKKAAATADEEIASCSAQILRSVIPQVSYEVKSQLAEDSAPIVLQLIQQRLHQPRSLLYESCLGLASRIIEHLNPETYCLLIDKVIKKEELVDLILKDLRHTPSTNRYPNIRRYCIELLISVINKEAAATQREVGASFLSILHSRSVNLVSVLHDTVDLISEVENFCLFCGLVGYAKHVEEMEALVTRAIEEVKNLEESRSSCS